MQEIQATNAVGETLITLKIELSPRAVEALSRHIAAAGSAPGESQTGAPSAPSGHLDRFLGTIDPDQVSQWFDWLRSMVPAEQPGQPRGQR